MRHNQQRQFFRIFQQKKFPVFSNISLGQFGPKTGSGCIALWALLCWFQTNLPLAALMMILVQLRKRHLPQRDDQAASSIKPIDR